MVEIVRGRDPPQNEWESLAQPLWQAEQIPQHGTALGREQEVAPQCADGAGRNALCNYACHHWPDSRQWWIFVGPGNNGGDELRAGPPCPGASASNLW